MGKERILSGNRPTGRLHWGNYFGALKYWVELQQDYECFYFVADWHSLTSEYENTSPIKKYVIEILVDWLAAGLDPSKSTIFIQSLVPEHAELHLLLSMITPLGWLERVPTYKEMKRELRSKDLNMYGFLGYPVLQTADIVIYNADKVPVGEDQLPHIEFAREIVRRFHSITGKCIFNEPQALLTPSPRVPGFDGRKMSKSFGNAVYLSDSENVVEEKLMRAITDPARKRRSDKGRPEVCNIWYYHKLFTDSDVRMQIEQDCRSASIGCVDCKKLCIRNANAFWQGFRESRKKYAAHLDDVWSVVLEGSKRAREIASENLQNVKKALEIDYSEEIGFSPQS